MTTNSAKGGDAADLRHQPSSTRPPTLWRRLKSAVHRNRAARQLHDLSDASLRDIGMTRPQPRRSFHI